FGYLSWNCWMTLWNSAARVSSPHQEASSVTFSLGLNVAPAAGVPPPLDVPEQPARMSDPTSAAPTATFRASEPALRVIAPHFVRGWHATACAVGLRRALPVEGGSRNRFHQSSDPRSQSQRVRFRSAARPWTGAVRAAAGRRRRSPESGLPAARASAPTPGRRAPRGG